MLLLIAEGLRTCMVCGLYEKKSTHVLLMYDASAIISVGNVSQQEQQCMCVMPSSNEVIVGGSDLDITVMSMTGVDIGPCNYVVPLDAQTLSKNSRMKHK